MSSGLAPLLLQLPQHYLCTAPLTHDTRQTLTSVAHSPEQAQGSRLSLPLTLALVTHYHIMTNFCQYASQAMAGQHTRRAADFPEQ